MEEKVIQEKFIQGYDCSQVVFSHFAERVGISEELANKISACFGGGMMQGDTCGAFTGALMAIGLKYGHYDGQVLLEQKEQMMAKFAEFKEMYDMHFASNKCKDLLGYDVAIPEQLEEALSSGRMMGFCPTVVKNVIEILEEIL